MPGVRPTTKNGFHMATRNGTTELTQDPPRISGKELRERVPRACFASFIEEIGSGRIETTPGI
jgi:hypothetical protein